MVNVMLYEFMSLFYSPQCDSGRKRQLEAWRSGCVCCQQC